MTSCAVLLDRDSNVLPHTLSYVGGLGGRESLVLTGSAQIKESAERAAVFAVLDATNRWTELRRPR